MSKKNRNFVDKTEIKDNARLVQKYNRIIAYLGGDDWLKARLLRRIDDYKMLEYVYNEFKAFPEKKDELLNTIMELNKDKRFNFFERLLNGSENEERHFLRRLELNKKIEIDLKKYSELSDDVKNKLLKQILDNPSYRKAKNSLGYAMDLMCDRWATQPSYSSYTPDRKGDMKSDACFAMFRGIEGFDCDRGSSIFAYFTETIKNCYNTYCTNKKIESNKEVGLDFLDNIQAGFKWERYGEE